MAASLFGGMLLVVCVFAWISFGAETRAKFTPFQVGTLVALGVLAFACGYALSRSRVVAEPHRLVVVNGYRRREFEYAEVVDAHLPPGAPWVTLDLADGTAISAMGIQSSDGERARTAFRQLLAVLASPPRRLG
jgi:Bacterial PH domain